MGLRMKIQNMGRDQQALQLIQVHILLSLLLPLLIFLLSGCDNKDVVDKKPSLGPEVKVEEVAQAIQSGIGNQSLNHLNVGDAALYELNQKVETGGTFKVAEVITYLREKNESAEDYIELVFSQQRTNFNGTDSEQEAEKDIVRSIEKIKEATAAAEIHSLAEKALPLPLFEQLIKPTAQKLTLHDLSISQEVRDPPERIKEKSDCGGLSPCQLQVTHITFDMAFWENDTQWSKAEIQLSLSPSLPMLDNIRENLFGWLPSLSVCINEQVQGQKRKYFLRTCSVLRDLQLATTP